MQVRRHKDARTGRWYVRYWRDGKAFTETTGVKDKGLAEKIRKTTFFSTASASPSR